MRKKQNKITHTTAKGYTKLDQKHHYLNWDTPNRNH